MALSYINGRNLEERIAVILDRNEYTGAPRMAKLIVEAIQNDIEYTGPGDDSYGSWQSSSAYC